MTRDREALPDEVEGEPPAETPEAVRPGVVVEQSVCPHLALRRDPATSARYPRPDHVCRAGRKPAPVLLEHQATFCTGGAYRDCLVFQGGAERPPAPPRSLRALIPLREITPLRAAAIALFVVVIPAAIGAVVAVSRGDEDSSPRPGTEVTALDSAANAAAAATAATEGATHVADAAEAPSDVAAEPTEESAAAASGDPVERLFAWTDLEEYVVQEGDALAAIAAEFGTTAEAIARLNGLSDLGAIFPGQRLQIPVGFLLELPEPEDAAGGADTSFAPVELTEEALALLQSWDNVVSWQVVEGDTLFGLAVQFETSVEAIAALNGLSNSRLEVGEVLQIPVGFQIPAPVEAPPEGGPVKEAPAEPVE